MKPMKALSVGKMLGSIRKKASGSNDAAAASRAVEGGGAPEVVARNNVAAFCEAGGSVQGDEVLFLPPIVDATESSPAAANEAARTIRKFMGKDYLQKPSRQYNAVMLVRILSDYPGPQFTRNFDDKFVETTAYLLKKARDPSLRQLLMETLDDMEHTKMDDQNLGGLVAMWKKEKEKALKDYGGVPNVRSQTYPPARPHAPYPNSHSQNYFARSHRNTQLPDPVELAGRLEEARTSAKLLEQVVMNTSPGEILDNDLIREFADRCLSASRSIQGYMVCDNPAPDNETMESLIDTNEQLQTALNQHQRAVLSARKQMSNESETPPAAPPRPNQLTPPSAMAGASGSASAGPPSRASTPSPPPPQDRKGKGKQAENPFADPDPNGGSYNHEERLAFEPFHPGFNSNHGAATGSSSAARPPQDYEVSDDDLYEPSGRGKEPARGV